MPGQFTDRPNRTFLDSGVLSRLSAVPLLSRFLRGEFSKWLPLVRAVGIRSE